MRKYSVTVEENCLTHDLPPSRGDAFMVKRLAPTWEDRREYPEGSLREIWHHHDHGIHCEHRPAITISYPSGGSALEQWFDRGQLHRTDAPAERRFSTTGILCAEAWYEHGQLHREDGPAERRFSSDGALCREAWYRHGRMHRLSGPALVERDPATNAITNEEWRVAGVLHRRSGPAQTIMRDDGSVEHRFYRQGAEIVDPLARGPARER